MLKFASLLLALLLVASVSTRVSDAMGDRGKAALLERANTLMSSRHFRLAWSNITSSPSLSSPFRWLCTAPMASDTDLAFSVPRGEFLVPDDSGIAASANLGQDVRLAAALLDRVRSGGDSLLLAWLGELVPVPAHTSTFVTEVGEREGATADEVEAAGLIAASSLGWRGRAKRGWWAQLHRRLIEALAGTREPYKASEFAWAMTVVEARANSVVREKKKGMLDAEDERVLVLAPFADAGEWQLGGVPQLIGKAPLDLANGTLLFFPTEFPFFQVGTPLAHHVRPASGMYNPQLLLTHGVTIPGNDDPCVPVIVPARPLTDHVKAQLSSLNITAQVVQHKPGMVNVMLHVCADETDPRDALCKGMSVLSSSTRETCLGVVRGMLGEMERAAGPRAEVDELAQSSPSRQVRDAARVLAAEMSVLEKARARLQQERLKKKEL